MKNIEINGLYFIELKANTKKAQELINNYNNSEIYNLYGAYSRPSYRKERAFNEIKEEAQKLNGYSIKITTYCLFYFTMAYKLNYQNKEYLLYYTPTYRYIIKLSETEGRNPDKITYEEAKERYNKLNPEIKEALGRSCPTLNSMEQVDNILKISEVFSLMADLMKGGK